jgi:hypothetical protein
MQLLQNLHLALNGRSMRAKEFGSPGGTPISDAFFGHFQMTLKCPMAASAETLVQAMTTVHCADGTNGNVKRIVMPVENRRLSGQTHELLRVWGDPNFAPADIRTNIAADLRSHGTRKHLRAKTMPENRDVTLYGIFQQCPFVLDPWQIFINAMIAAQHDNAAKPACINGRLSIRCRRNESVRDTVFIQVIAQYTRPLR